MKLPIYQFDAFTSRRFGGNPAAVVILDRWLDDRLMQAIAAENNLPETAFVVASQQPIPIRWFSPTVEVELCGHATLASAAALLVHQSIDDNRICFDSGAGPLEVIRDGDMLSLNFPSRKPQRMADDPSLVSVLGATPIEFWQARDAMCVFERAAQVEALRPDFEALRRMDYFGVIATAPGPASDGTPADFVSRFFAPGCGIDEDPATGSAHCTLIPYWSERLGKRQLTALQISARRGEFRCTDQGDRVLIGGQAVAYLSGEIEIADPSADTL